MFMLEKNSKIREEIWDSVKGLSDEQLNKVVVEGQWSIAQVLEHLRLMEENAVRGIREVLSKDEYNPTDPKPMHLIADRTIKRDAPDYLIPSNEFQTLEELRAKLSSSREALENSIQGVSEEDLNNKSFPHRRFGLLSVTQWISLLGFHEQRHIGQIEEIKQSL